MRHLKEVGDIVQLALPSLLAAGVAVGVGVALGASALTCVIGATVGAIIPVLGYRILFKNFDIKSWPSPRQIRATMLAATAIGALAGSAPAALEHHDRQGNATEIVQGRTALKNIPA